MKRHAANTDAACRLDASMCVRDINSRVTFRLVETSGTRCGKSTRKIRRMHSNGNKHI